MKEQKIDNDDDESSKEDSEKDDDEIPEDEMEYVDTFLNMFARDEGETFIDVKLTLDSLPKKIDNFNVSRCE